MRDDQLNKLITAIKDLTDVLKEIRDIQKSWEDAEEEIDFNNTDNYIL